MSIGSETDLIQKYFAPLSGEGAFKLRDDCAALTIPDGFDLVVTVDSVTEGIDFFKNADAAEVAAKALRVNISDLTAKGAMPFAYVMSLSLPAIDEHWLAEFSAQLACDQKTYGIDLIGGDTTRAPVLSATITAMGLVPHQRIVQRSGAKAGDILCVTGTIGDSALGLQILKKNISYQDEKLASRYRFPDPPAKIARYIYHYATAALDISDGFIGDIITLCERSSCGAQIQLNNVPYSTETKSLFQNDAKWVETALTGGDDYQVALTVKPDDFQRLQQLCAKVGVQLTDVGVVTGTTKVEFLQGKTPRIFARGAYSHFS